jgi:chromosome segregation ATPase
MTVMDIERTMQFILDSQARLEASAQMHDERIAKNSEQIAKNSEQIAKTSQQVATLTDLVGRLAQAEIRLVEEMRGSEARTAELMQGKEARLGALETKMTQFLDRMDRFIQGMEGNGHKLQ